MLPLQGWIYPNSYLLPPLSPARLSESQAGDSSSGCSNQQLLPGEPPGSDFKGKGAAPGREGEAKRRLTLLAPGSKCNLTYGSAKPLWSIGFRPWRGNSQKAGVRTRARCWAGGVASLSPSTDAHFPRMSLVHGVTAQFPQDWGRRRIWSVQDPGCAAKAEHTQHSNVVCGLCRGGAAGRLLACTWHRPQSTSPLFQQPTLTP